MCVAQMQGEEGKGFLLEVLGRGPSENKSGISQNYSKNKSVCGNNAVLGALLLDVDLACM